MIEVKQKYYLVIFTQFYLKTKPEKKTLLPRPLLDWRAIFLLLANLLHYKYWNEQGKDLILGNS